MKFRTIAVLALVLTVAMLLIGAAPSSQSGNGDQATWTVIMGLLAPLAWGFLQQAGWSDKVNSYIALVVCFLVAFADAMWFGSLDWANLVQVVRDIIVTAYASYEMIWKPLGAIELWVKATSFLAPAR